jgi:hypothetical protein
MSPCVCKIGFEFCALGDAVVCYRYSLFPNTLEGRRAAKAINGRVRDDDTYLDQIRTIREMAREKEKGKKAA